MFRKFVFILFLVIGSIASSAQKLSDKIRIDSSEVVLRTSDKIEKYRGKSDFIYDDNAALPVTFFQKLWYYFLRFLDAIFSDDGIAPYIRYIIYFIFVPIVVWLLLRMNFGSVLFRKGKNNANAELEMYDENLLYTDFDQLITTSLAEKDYRAAVRFLYLKLLKNLALKEIINWQAEKTNRDYRDEMKKTPHSSIFETLTRNYEYVWYGHFQINPDMFYRVKEQFFDMFKKLNIK